MGKLTISMAIFNSELLNYQRVKSFLKMGDPQNHGFQDWNGLMTGMIWGAHDLGNLHILKKSEYAIHQWP